MELKDILAKCDHTLLTQTATWAEIKGVCDDGMKYHTASVCIPASYVKQAKEYVGDRLPICTVIGFPNGYDTTAAKCFMASDAVANGADEVDMVINIGWAKDGLWEKITEEIAAVKAAYEQYSRRIPTGVLNEALADAQASLQPPVSGGRRLKIYYATQQSACPPTFVFFVNSEELMHFAYERYLENHLRKSFGFEGTPVRFILREKTKD